MAADARLPLDYSARDYAYLERPNAVLLDLLRRHVFSRTETPRVLDIGAGAGANARAVRGLSAGARVVAIEPNPRATVSLRKACDRVFEMNLSDWLEQGESAEFDAVLLSDVVEHWENPVSLLKRLARQPGLSKAAFLISVPNYAVWYNRLLTLAGRFEYAFSGLYDRTHLRFFTRQSTQRVLEYVGFSVLAQSATPSLVQSLAPWLRRGFSAELAQGQHSSLEESRLYGAYRRFVEPLETRVCACWPELLGFQIVTLAALPSAAARWA